MKKYRLTLSALLALLILVPAGVIADDKEIPDFSTTPRAEVPVEYTWNVNDIFENDEAWQAAREETMAKVAKMEEMVGDWTSSSANMLEFLKMQEDVMKNAFKLFAYVSLQNNTDLANAKFQMMRGGLIAIFVKMQSKFSGVNDDILALGEEKFEAYVKEEPGLEPFAFGFRELFRQKEHILKGEQQKIVSLMGTFAGAPAQVSSTLRDVDMPRPDVTLSTGETVPLNIANYGKYRGSAVPEDRSLVMRTMWENQAKYENTFAVILDAEMKQHHFNSQIHNYPDTLTARMDGDNIDTSVYYNTIKHVRENLPLLHRYLRLKKELLGLETYRYDDIYADAVKSVNRLYTWEEAQAIIMDMMSILGNDYLEGLKLAFANRWIDRYPNKDKQSGAYSSGVYGVHPYIKMNYDGQYDNVSTLAHELGHSMHSYFSQKTQTFQVAQYVTFLAEMASTFNEHVLVNYMLNKETDDMFKLYLIGNFIEQMRGTIFRQVLFAEFELAMHQRVEKGGTLTADWLNREYLRLTREYYGHADGTCVVDDYIQVEWSAIPHFFRNYYVINYATGMISSTALYEMVSKGGEEGRAKYIAFLSAGGSKYPLDILKEAGVDMTTDEPYKLAFARLEAYITEMEEIVKRLKEQGKL